MNTLSIAEGEMIKERKLSMLQFNNQGVKIVKKSEFATSVSSITTF